MGPSRVRLIPEFFFFSLAEEFIWIFVTTDAKFFHRTLGNCLFLPFYHICLNQQNVRSTLGKKEIHKQHFHELKTFMLISITLVEKPFKRPILTYLYYQSKWRLFQTCRVLHLLKLQNCFHYCTL